MFCRDYILTDFESLCSLFYCFLLSHPNIYYRTDFFYGIVRCRAKSLLSAPAEILRAQMPSRMTVGMVLSLNPNGATSSTTTWSPFPHRGRLCYAHSRYLLPRSGVTLKRNGATAVKNIVALLGTRDCPRIARCFFLSAPSLHRHLGAGCHGASNVLLRKTFPHTTRSTPFYA